MNPDFPLYELCDQMGSKIAYYINRYMSQVMQSTKKTELLFFVVLNTFG